jgi:hypothetical protein
VTVGVAALDRVVVEVAVAPVVPVVDAHPALMSTAHMSTTPPRRMTETIRDA